jgi:ABC-2 type transport system ATP-binding protein
LGIEERTLTMIEVMQLGKIYPGGVAAVQAVEFEVHAGEVFGLLGPNGAGKSTTIGMLTTTIQPTSGSARLAGFDVAEQPREARRVSSVVFQEPVVDRALTGRRNLLLHARLWSVEVGLAARRIQNAVDAFGIGDIIDRPVASFSGGQVRRLEIARALISRPAVLFLDEPTVGLDTRIRYELLDLIDDLRASNDMTTLLTTHYLDEAERLCDRVAIISQGQIVALDTPRDLLASLGREVLELRVPHDPQPVLNLLRTHQIAGDDSFAVGSTLTIPLRDRTAGAAIAQITELEVATTAMSTRPPTLDDVYLRLTGDRLAA